MTVITRADDTAPIPLARPALGEAELAAAAAALRSGRLVLGPHVDRFERALAARTGRQHAVCVTSGTTALELALWAAGVGGPGRGPAGDPGQVPHRVVVPAASFPAAAHAVLRLGAVPVAADIDSETWNLDPDRVVEAVDARAPDAASGPIRAIVAIDGFGLLADHARLSAIADAAGAVLIDDAACSLGASDAAGCPGGGYGVAGALSFHPRKVITTGEGGAVVCDDPDLAAALRQLRNHGQAARGRFARPGTNARLSEPAAALGCAQLDRLDVFLAERRLLAAGYRERLTPLHQSGRLRWQRAPSPDSADMHHAYQTFAVLLDDAFDRDRVIAALAEAGIEAGVAGYALDRLDSVRGVPGLAPASAGEASGAGGSRFPVADALHERGLALPLYVGMRSAQLDRVCEALAGELR